MCAASGDGAEPPLVRVRPPGPESRTWLTRMGHVAAPMGPAPSSGAPSSIVYATARGANVVDVDGNRYVDLAAGFGSLLLGHAHPAVRRVLDLQSDRLLQAMGDVHPSDAKVGLLERLARLYPERDARVVVSQSGSDAVAVALKTAALFTGKPGVVAFHGAYHGLGYGPLAACGLRAGYREPFAAQLNPHVHFVEYPRESLDALASVDRALAAGNVGAVLVEPILGRGGCIPPPPAFLRLLAGVCRERRALLIADEVWTGLGRSGAWLYSEHEGACADLICLGKGLGGGLPLSACIGRREVMDAWRREPEVVHTSTFAGAPLAAATTLATLDALRRERLVERAAAVGTDFRTELERALCDTSLTVRGRGLMLGIDCGPEPGAAIRLQRLLLENGYITSTGGGAREALILTPPLTIAEHLLEGFVAAVTALAARPLPA